MMLRNTVGLYACAAATAVILLGALASSLAGADGEVVPVAATTVEQPQDGRTAAMIEVAKREPMALVRMGRERYDREVHSYRCMLTKQERLDGKLGAVQKIELRYREQPKSVYMLWREGADGARRALYVDSADFVDGDGEKVARVEPNGAIVRLFTTDVKVPIHGSDARKASRRMIDEAGFRATFELLERYNTEAQRRGVLDLRFGGTGEVCGRPTFKIERNLPYGDGKAGFPDGRMVLHLDQESLLPVAVFSYVDRDEKELLGSYVFTQIELNPPFRDEDFRF